jgi:hypothetical protein
MTLIPSEAWNVAGVEGDKYTVGPFCDAPGCKRPVDHKHHLWRRSFLGGDFWWVRVPLADNKTTVIRNVIGLCYRHHEDVTGGPGGHKAWIRWVEEDQKLLWLEPGADDQWELIDQIVLAAPSEGAAPRAKIPKRCPACGKLQYVEHEHAPAPRRPRKSWVVQVPSDNEDGAAILDELIEIIAEAIGTDEYKSQLRRYHTLIPALVWVVQNQEDFARDFYDEQKEVV